MSSNKKLLPFNSKILKTTMEEEKTAIEWLVSNIDWMLLKNSSWQYSEIIKLAKEKEKQQLEKAFRASDQYFSFELFYQYEIEKKCKDNQ